MDRVKRQIALGTGLVLLGLVAWPVRASPSCDVPAESWQPREAVLALAARQRWQVDRLKVDDGCYEIKGRDADGRRFKAKIDPATLEVLRIRHEHRERDRDRERKPGGD